MIKKVLALSISLAFSVTSALTYAEGNIAKGQSQAESCASCHGDGGNSMVPNFPKLAGQHAGYLEKQLHAFKNNMRNAPMMAPLAMSLNKQTISNISAYYASKKVSSNPMPFLDDDDDEDDNNNNSATVEELIALGSDLYRNGNLETEVSACIACHSPNGEGNKPSDFPSLKGQHADYLIKSLTDFKNGVRSNSSDNMMSMIAKKMSKEEIQAVSFHISTLK